MKRPVVLFSGEYDRCQSVMDKFSSIIRPLYIERRHINYSRIYRKKPMLICIALEKGVSICSRDYQDILLYSRKTKCPVYLLCTYDQYDGLRAAYKETVIYRVTLSGLYKVIRSAVKLTESCGGDELSLIKSRFEPFVIMSENAALASYCESIICGSKETNNRIILTSSDYETVHRIISEKDNYCGFMVTENRSGCVSDGIVELSEIDPKDNVTVAFVGTDETREMPSGIKYISTGSAGEAADIIRKSKLARMRKNLSEK